MELACSALSQGRRPDRAELRRMLSLERARLAAATGGAGPRRVGRGGAGVVSPARELAERADPEVMEALREWRATTAKASGVPAYVVFHDATLAALAQAQPRTADELLALPGLGPVKAARYGETLLALLARLRPSA